jgi:hypothetical protein
MGISNQHQQTRSRLLMESDDDDIPASYLLYIVAVMVAIGVAVVSTFFFLIR